MNLMRDYKKEPGGKEKLKERNPKWINDDYVKFLRYGQYFIEKNGEGVLAFINPHGFLDNPTFRGMRWNLLKTYDKIYTIDLHGNSKKKEICPDGSPDVNVFDIMQGVSINVFVKTGKKKKNDLGKIFHYDLYGKRESKYQFLCDNNINSVPYVELPNVKPNYFFVQKDFDLQKEYDKGFLISQLMQLNSVGVVTAREAVTILFDKEKLLEIIEDFKQLEIEKLRGKHNLPKDTRDWKISFAKKDLTKNNGVFVKIAYKPFDLRETFFTGTTKGFYSYPRKEVMSNLINKKNVGLVVSKQAAQGFKHVFITCTICNLNLTGTAGKYGAGYTFPLYLYPDPKPDGIFTEKDRKPNLNTEIVEQIANKLGLEFTDEKEETKNTFAPIDILDYIYAVLHSPAYREKYKEFLKIDFPRVPYPKNKATFWQLVKAGGEIRQIHLLENPKTEEYITSYPIDGNNTVTTKIGKQDWVLTDKETGIGRIWINKEQYFDNIPLKAWEFYIGGYQPAQKWLKDRKKRTLNYDDITWHGHNW